MFNPCIGKIHGEGKAIHPRTLAREIPQTEGPGGLQSMGSQRETRLGDSATTKLCAREFNDSLC